MALVTLAGQRERNAELVRGALPTLPVEGGLYKTASWRTQRPDCAFQWPRSKRRVLGYGGRVRRAVVSWETSSESEEKCLFVVLCGIGRLLCPPPFMHRTCANVCRKHVHSILLPSILLPPRRRTGRAQRELRRSQHSPCRASFTSASSAVRNPLCKRSFLSGTLVLLSRCLVRFLLRPGRGGVLERSVCAHVCVVASPSPSRFAVGGH